jgi:hypothetical protein
MVGVNHFCDPPWSEKVQGGVSPGPRWSFGLGCIGLSDSLSSSNSSLFSKRINKVAYREQIEKLSKSKADNHYQYPKRSSPISDHTTADCIFALVLATSRHKDHERITKLVLSRKVADKLAIDGWCARLISGLSRGYPRPPSQQVSHILRHLEHCSFARMSISDPPQTGQAGWHGFSLFLTFASVVFPLGLLPCWAFMGWTSASMIVRLKEGQVYNFHRR